MKNSPIDSKITGLRNERLVLALLKEHGSLSQSQLCELAHLNSSTASYIVSRLREKDLILETRGKSNKRGAKPVIVSINPNGRFVVGVEINPSNLVLGLFNFNYELLETIMAPIAGTLAPENILTLLEINLHGIMGKHNVAENKLLGIGITLSGSIAEDGQVLLSSPLGWKNVPLKTMLNSRFACPITIHTTSVRVLAETSIDPALSSSNMLYVNVGNGVGCNMIVDGNLVRGSTNRFGELGHMIIDPAGPACGCGHKGCLEAFISGPALAKKIKNDITAGTETEIKNTLDQNDIPEEIVQKWGQALQAGDNYALELQNFLADYLSKAVTTAINCYDPDVVMLAGYVTSQCTDFLAEAIKKRISTDVYDNSARQINITPAKAGMEALIRGVATAILNQSFKVL